jgi:hypothetical protein
VREGKILGAYIKQHFLRRSATSSRTTNSARTAEGPDFEILQSQVVSRQSYVPTNVNIGPRWPR